MSIALTLPRKWMLFILSFIIVLQTKAMTEPNSKIFSLLNGLPYTEIPFRLINDLIIVPVNINGEKDLNFLVDTGTNSPVILHERYVKDLELHLGRKIHFQGAGRGKAVEGTVISCISIQVGDAYAKQMGAVVLQNNPLARLKLKGTTIHGIIGASLFRSFAVEIDYLTQVIRLHEGSGFLEENTFSPHPMQVVMSRPIVRSEARWNDEIHMLNLMIDTGFNHHLLIYDNTSIEESSPKFERLGFGYSGSITGSSSNLPMLKLGKRKLFKVNTFFPTFKAYKADEATISYRDGIIGNALLKQFCVVLDYAHNTFYIREHLGWSPMLVKDEARQEQL
ncbi:putative aspartyl protease [Catalinimonas alkaloidigena]|uniref:retropepsin-like aspartic protease n=1 Tax=Catalinimonas alkaloidigena TaxID=1075417 RepID=UPI0024057ADF|nr:retropepsin-like aspartic protease [Catalinimonas alkaloidigena]MDF9795735.1 putative aspartyl protease [Catalinimonas alkaloidigena]